jgi:hypothetical protein
MTYGQLAFEAYVSHCDEICVLGDDTPAWAGQDPEVRAHWEAAGLAVYQAVTR